EWARLDSARRNAILRANAAALTATTKMRDRHHDWAEELDGFRGIIIKAFPELQKQPTTRHGLSI
ncbi:MAG: hypothetical protein LBC18_14830, partial [Opitutaceae bacterium]|nr:hypothetical protein [Opitutaceae bacterium]